MHFRSLFPTLLITTGLFASSATGRADHQIHVNRDYDHDGHYNRKTYDTGHHYYYGHGYGYGYGYGYYPRPYWGWYRPYYYYAPTAVGVSVYNSDRYSRYSHADSLASEVQRALKSRGYYGGPVDGEIGSGSRSAIRNYQRDRGLGVTGRIDTALLRSLRIG